jgi:hypothetical protein
VTDDAIHEKIREELFEDTASVKISVSETVPETVSTTVSITRKTYCHGRACSYCGRTPEELRDAMPDKRGTTLSCHGLDVVNPDVTVLHIDNLVRFCCFSCACHALRLCTSALY